MAFCNLLIGLFSQCKAFLRILDQCMFCYFVASLFRKHCLNAEHMGLGSNLAIQSKLHGLYENCVKATKFLRYAPLILFHFFYIFVVINN